MWEIILVILVIALIVAAWVFLVPMAAMAGALVAFVLAVIASFGGIIRGVTDTFEDEEGRMHDLYYDGKEPAKKSWFFGPCFSVFPLIFKHAFFVIRNQSGWIIDKWLSLMSHGLLAKVFFAPIGAVIVAVHWVVGFTLAAFWAIFFCIMFLISLGIFYLLFGIIKGIDGIVLRARGLKNHCPNCNELSLVPEYVCPYCGRIHKHLTPNKYGIFNHQCECGAYLGSTYFTGKSHLHAVCPHCGEPFKTGATKPFTLQLVGGTSAGKTVYLSSLLHRIHQIAYGNQVQITPDPSSKDNLQEVVGFARGRGDPGATHGRDVTFYAEVVDMGKGKTPIKLEVVDIPGEMFAGETALQEGLHKMSQYNYADGFVFLVDPYSDGDLSNSHPSDGTAISPVSSEEVLHSFDQYLIAQKFAKPDQLITKPISIVVVKSDTEAIRKELTMELIQEEFDANPSLYKGKFENCRDQKVKELLMSIGQSALVSNIESRFKNAHFFLASAMGHAPQLGKKYQPVQIYESVEWIMSSVNAPLYNRINGK